jgi:hypothetical protein
LSPAKSGTDPHQKPVTLKRRRDESDPDDGLSWEDRDGMTT